MAAVQARAGAAPNPPLRAGVDARDVEAPRRTTTRAGSSPLWPWPGRRTITTCYSARERSGRDSRAKTRPHPSEGGTPWIRTQPELNDDALADKVRLLAELVLAA